jgi:glucose dehydrogenase
MEYLIRFLAGGLVVSAFAVLGDVLRPKSFAGLFGAAPSVALATLGLALWKEGGDYVSLEGRSMILGALALALYSVVVCRLLVRARWSALSATTAAILLWLAAAIGSEYLLTG